MVKNRKAKLANRLNTTESSNLNCSTNETSKDTISVSNNHTFDNNLDWSDDELPTNILPMRDGSTYERSTTKGGHKGPEKVDGLHHKLVRERYEQQLREKDLQLKVARSNEQKALRERAETKKQIEREREQMKKSCYELNKRELDRMEEDGDFEQDFIDGLVEHGMEG